MHVIYVDVLLVCSLLVDYLLLRLTARLTHSRLSFARALVAAVFGSFSSLLVLLPPMPAALSILCNLVTAVLLCLAAFGCRDVRRLFWHCLCFLGMSCMLAGMLLALSLAGARVYFANGSWYPDISLHHLVLFTVVSYGLLTAVQRLQNRSHTADGCYQVYIRYGQHTVKLDGIADTGNSLVDFYTGKPVIICPKARLSSLLPDELPPRGFRPLPCATVAGEGMVLCFTPDEVVIRSEHRRKPVDVLIGMTEHESEEAIFHPRLLYY